MNYSSKLLYVKKINIFAICIWNQDLTIYNQACGKFYFGIHRNITSNFKELIIKLLCNSAIYLNYNNTLFYIAFNGVHTH